MSSSKQHLVRGTRITAYNFATDCLIAVSKAPINSWSNAHSGDTNNLIFTKCTKRSVFLCMVTYSYEGHFNSHANRPGSSCQTILLQAGWTQSGIRLLKVKWPVNLVSPASPVFLRGLGKERGYQEKYNLGQLTSFFATSTGTLSEPIRSQ